MKEEYVFLTSVSEAESELIRQRLSEANIKSELRDDSENFVFDIYGGHTPIGKRLFVLSSDLERAKELLEIKEKDFSPSVGKTHSVFKIIAFILVAIFILGILLNVFAVFRFK